MAAWYSPKTWLGGAGNYVGDFFDVVGDALGTNNSDQVDDAKGYLDESKTLWDQNKETTQGYLDEYLGTVSDSHNDSIAKNESLYGDANQKYQDAMNNYESLGGYNAQNFNYDKSVDDFMSPAVEMRQKAAANAITKSQANAGNMFSSDYLDALNAKSQAIASEEYDKAYDRYNTDRVAALNEWNAQNDELHKAYDSQSDLYKNLASQYGSDRDAYMSNYTNITNGYNDNLGDYYSNLINSENAYTQGVANINAAKGDTALSEQHGIGGILGSLGGAVGSIIGAIA